MRLSVGVDPDVHGCAFGYLCEAVGGGYSPMVRVVRQKEFTSREAAIALIQQCDFRCAVQEGEPVDVITVEGQDVRYTGKTSRANPQDVCNLALITGAAITLSDAEAIYSPLPRDWKGNVPKHIHQQRVLKALGIEYEMRGGKSPYPVPINFQKYAIGKVDAGDWKDLTDALGLALWGMEKYKKELSKR